jgi:hypothetical protein
MGRAKSLGHNLFKSGGAELTADIYDMGKREDAFGIYAAERSPGYKFITIGVEGYRSEEILNLAGTGAYDEELSFMESQGLHSETGGLDRRLGVVQPL